VVDIFYDGSRGSVHYSIDCKYSGSESSVGQSGEEFEKRIVTSYRLPVSS
jgi:hypothetical protein